MTKFAAIIWTIVIVSMSHAAVFFRTYQENIGRPGQMLNIPPDRVYTVYIYDKAQNLATIVCEDEPDVRLVHDPMQLLLPYVGGTPFIKKDRTVNFFGIRFGDPTPTLHGISGRKTNKVTSTSMRRLTRGDLQT